MTTGRTTDPDKAGAAPDEAAPSVTATPEAGAALAAAARDHPGKGLRLWVEGGIHPQVRMMFDRPNDRDLEGHIGELPVYVDAQSRRFLVDARIELVRSSGQTGFRVVGPNTPVAPGSTPPAPAAGSSGAPLDRAGVEERIRGALKQIYDPEIPMNLIDLGLLYGIEWASDTAVTIRITLTSVGCPATEQILGEVERAVRAATGLPEVKVEVVWEPRWTPERMSLFAKRQFGYV